MAKRQSLTERFWSKVDRSGGPDSCHEWMAGRFSDGYGQFKADGPKRAHRFAWSLEVGPIPDGLQVCHRCDNPICCNVLHLFLGTHDDNHADKARKGRARNGSRTHPECLARGEANGWSKLTEQQVRAIRADQRSSSVIAGELNVRRWLIWAVRARKAWKHVL